MLLDSIKNTFNFSPPPEEPTAEERLKPRVPFTAIASFLATGSEIHVNDDRLLEKNTIAKITGYDLEKQLIKVEYNLVAEKNISKDNLDSDNPEKQGKHHAGDIVKFKRSNGQISEGKITAVYNPPNKYRVTWTETQQKDINLIEFEKLNPKITEFVEKDMQKPVTVDGYEVNNLFDAKREKTLKCGDQVVVASHLGARDHNEDRAIIIPEADAMAVVDGMGGHNNGELAAKLLTDTIAEFWNNPEKILAITQSRYRQHGVGDGGACFLFARDIKEGQKRFLETRQAGDVKLVVCGANGKIKYVSRDQSLLQTMIDGGFPADAALYDSRRNQVVNPVTSQTGSIEVNKVPVKPGDKFFIYSDGVGDCITPEELVDITEGKSPSEAMKIVSLVTTARMRNIEKLKKETDTVRKKQGVYSDGYKSLPVKDNVSFITGVIN